MAGLFFHVAYPFLPQNGNSADGRLLLLMQARWTKRRHFDLRHWREAWTTDSMCGWTPDTSRCARAGSIRSRKCHHQR